MAEPLALGFSLSEESLDALANAVLDRIAARADADPKPSPLDRVAERVAQQLPERSPWFTVAEGGVSADRALDDEEAHRGARASGAQALG
jgi:hypothetical protein